MAEQNTNISAQRLADKALEIEYNGKTLKEWIDLIAGRECIPIPCNATNGDVIKTLFPDGSQVKGASIYIMDDNKSNVFYDFDWWNAPYKTDKEEENNDITN